MDNLTHKEEHNENEINKKSLGVEKPHLACFVTQRKKSSDTTDKQQEDCKQENNFEDNFDELVDSAGD